MTMPESPTADLSPGDFTMLADLVHKHCGINLHEGKVELVQARLAKLTRTAGFASAKAYVRHATADATARPFRELIDALSTNLTSFFREVQHFDYLNSDLLPRIALKKKQDRVRQIRAWSAGCSTGEEPYSLAMTLLEHFDPSEWDTKLLATDISTRVLETARRGVYDKSRVSSIPPALRNKYLAVNKFEGQVFYEATDAVRNVIAFRHLNLMEPWPFRGPFDFIFCRNVMIYFDKPTQQRLVNRYADVLAPGGMLFTGHSESLTGISHGLRYVRPTIYAKA